MQKGILVNRNYIYLVIVSVALLVLWSCQSDVPRLPILGKPVIVQGDTLPYTIPQFKYVNQDSQWVSNADFTNGIYLADFFFTSCPSICPKVQKQMHRLYDEFVDEPSVKLISFTLDPKRDNTETLKLYAENQNVDRRKWVFLTGDQQETMDLAFKFFISAYTDADAPGGIVHSGKIILVDSKGQVRSFGEGTDPENIDVLISDVKRLIKEEKLSKNF